MTINTITIEGNLTADPELRYTTNGKPVLNFNIAHNTRRYNKTTQQWEDGDPTFIRGSLWGQPAENAAATLSKGTTVIATGRIQQKNWEKDGETRTALELQAEMISPSLKWSTATMQRNPGSGQGSGPKEGPFAGQQTNDPWNNSPAPAGGGSALTNEEPPF